MATGDSGRNNLKVRVRSAKGRSPSSTRWLQRQLNDPFVAAAKKQGYRSRAGFKLIEIADQFSLLRSERRVLDLGACPGAWSQVAIERGCAVVAVDLSPMEPLAGATVIEGDVHDAATVAKIGAAAGGAPFDVVLSDMAAPATGHRSTDHIRVIALCEAAYAIACDGLRPGGAFVAKVLRGGTEMELLNRLKRSFASVRHFKPKASRMDSAEMYVVALNFHGTASGG